MPAINRHFFVDNYVKFAIPLLAAFSFLLKPQEKPQDCLDIWKK